MNRFPFVKFGYFVISIIGYLIMGSQRRSECLFTKLTLGRLIVWLYNPVCLTSDQGIRWNQNVK